MIYGENSGENSIENFIKTKGGIKNEYRDGKDHRFPCEHKET
jgi:hypothetical protein